MTAPLTIRRWSTDDSATLPSEPLACIPDGPIMHLVINRPSKRNAMTADIWRRIADVSARLSVDPTVKLVVVRGAGEGSFSAGADIEEFPLVFATPETIRAYNNIVQKAQIAIERLAKPTIALIRGSCVGGGCGVAMACDIRFAAEDARIGIPPSKLGTAYSVSDTRRLVALVGLSWAKDLLFSGRLVGADDALQIGLVNYVVRADELETQAAKYCQQLLSNSLNSIRTAKAIVNAEAGIDPREEQELHTSFEASFSSPDFKEGYAAFLEKRRPKFE